MTETNITLLIWKELTNHHLPPHLYQLEHNTYHDIYIITLNICKFPAENPYTTENEQQLPYSIIQPSLHIKLQNGNLHIKQQWTKEETTFILADPKLFQNITKYLKNWTKTTYTTIQTHLTNTTTYYKQNKYKIPDANQKINECKKAQAYITTTLKRLH